MGVDISTYRMRIGSFGPRLGKSDVGTIGISTATLIIIVGAVVFIRQLLFMAGIESNPGPPTGVEFNFRYQYLLIEVGTNVLRHLFDHIVNNDFCQFLNMNQAAENQLKFLFLKNIITTDQQQFLPPIDTKPSSTNFDITLLCCLLRNACGLKPINGQSWKKPTATDNSVEANICRLRECRNELMHSGSVFSLAVNLDAKWKNLSKILNDLNTVCKMPNLTSLINDAEHMDIDDNLRRHYDFVLRVWIMTDNSEELIHGQTLLQEGQSTLTKGQSQLKHGHIEIKDGNLQIIKNQTQLADGHSKLTQGQTQLKDGQSQIIKNQTQLTEGLSKLTEGQTQLKDKQSQIIKNQTQLADGHSKLTQGQTQLKDGQSQIIKNQTQLTEGHSKLTEGQMRLKDGQSQIIKNQTQLTEGHSKLTEGQMQLKDKQSQIIKNQTQLTEGHSKLTEGQTQLKDGQSQIIKNQTQLTEGHSKLTDGQTQLKDGQSQIIKNQTQLTEGHSKLTEGQTQLKDGQSQIIKNQTQLLEGHSKLTDGQTQLKDVQSQIMYSQTLLTERQKQVTYVQSQMVHQLGQDLPILKAGIENLEKIQHQHAERFMEISNCQQRTQIHIDNIDKSVQDGQHRMLINESELMNHLITIYIEDCSTLPVLPLCEGDEDEKELLSFYQPPSLCHKPYHKSQENDDKYQITSYREIFYNNDQHFRKVYITGDAGTGKTSLCKRMVLLWCKGKSGETVSDKIVQDDIDFMAEFDFVFYVSLGGAKCTDIITIIAEQLFCNANDDKKNPIELILKTKQCLVIMDALDEYNENGKININRLLSDKCAFMITCRPFLIETHRLSPNDIDRQIEITGINGDSIKSYVNEIVNHMNEATGVSKITEDFVTDAHASEVYKQLHIPILGSHLVWLWFNHGLTHMSQALIYSHIIDMLLERAETVKHFAFSSSPVCDVQFPDSLSELNFLKQNVTFLKTVCLLSFNLPFKTDKNLSQLVFTKAQLMSKPYYITIEEVNYLCKFGILSKSKVIGSLEKREQKISFLHKSYLEYFAALFVSSFDMNNEFDNVVTSWKSPEDTLQHETFFRFYVGLFPTKRIPLSGDLCLAIIDHIIFRPYTYSKFLMCRYEIESIQDMVKRVFNQTRNAYEINMACLKIKHFTFSKLISYNDILKQLAKLNSSDVKSLFVSDPCTYLNEFDQINKLQILMIQNVHTSTIKMFTGRLILKNKSTLNTLCINNLYRPYITLDLTFKQMNFLTSISLRRVKLQHNNYDYLVKFLSNNINMVNIRLVFVQCNTHQYHCSKTLDLTNKTKLKYLSLIWVNIVCIHVSRTELPNLKSFILKTVHRNMETQCVNLFNAILSSQLTYLDVDGSIMLDSYTIKKLVSTIQSLKSIRELRLWSMVIPDDVLLQFHPDVSEIKIILFHITMSKTWFNSFIDIIRTNTSSIKVELRWCELTTVVGGKYHMMPKDKSVKYMYNSVKKIPNVKITAKSEYLCIFFFEMNAPDQFMVTYAD